MKLVRAFSLVLVLVFISQVAAFAGAPAPTTERPIPVEQVAPPPPPPPPPPTPKVKPLVISKHFTLGLGLGGNPLIGFVEKDQYNIPRVEYGLCTGIGIAMTWFSGLPSAEQINAAAAKVLANNPGVTDKELPSLVRKELGITSLNYVGLGVLNAEMGTEWILADNCRTRFGFGLPFIISFGINWDF
jgi:hypothetical protein